MKILDVEDKDLIFQTLGCLKPCYTMSPALESKTVTWRHDRWPNTAIGKTGKQNRKQENTSILHRMKRKMNAISIDNLSSEDSKGSDSNTSLQNNSDSHFSLSDIDQPLSILASENGVHRKKQDSMENTKRSARISEVYLTLMKRHVSLPIFHGLILRRLHENGVLSI